MLKNSYTAIKEETNTSESTQIHLVESTGTGQAENSPHVGLLHLDVPLSFSNKEEARASPSCTEHPPTFTQGNQCSFCPKSKARMWFFWCPVEFYFPWIMLAMLIFLQTISSLKTLLKKFYHPIKARLISSKRGKPQQPVLKNHTNHLPLLSWTAITKLNPLVTCALFSPSGCWQLSSLCRTTGTETTVLPTHDESPTISDILCAGWKPGISCFSNYNCQHSRWKMDFENRHSSFSVLVCHLLSDLGNIHSTNSGVPQC